MSHSTLVVSLLIDLCTRSMPSSFSAECGGLAARHLYTFTIPPLLFLLVCTLPLTPLLLIGVPHLLRSPVNLSIACEELFARCDISQCHYKSFFFALQFDKFAVQLFRVKIVVDVASQNVLVRSRINMAIEAEPSHHIRPVFCPEKLKQSQMCACVLTEDVSLLCPLILFHLSQKEALPCPRDGGVLHLQEVLTQHTATKRKNNSDRSSVPV
mmetsp:Transcript_34777/g.68660  ORF Transcript_34777/g.68660 Transcript_34777/m.68660 type:complete len:212 (+) Transcript_34777:342-977(+)